MLSACDLCHLRKVRCDRQAICANCVDARVECRRDRRPKAPSKPKALSSILSLGERVSNLERLTNQPRGNSHSPNVPDVMYTESNNTNESDKETSAERRKLNDHTTRSESAPQGHAEWATASEDSSHRAKQAKAILQNELSIDNDLISDRRTILRSALDLVEKVANRKNLDLGGSSLLRMAETHYEGIEVPDVPPPELLYMLLGEQSPTLNVGKYVQVQWPDHVTGKSLEEMATQLLNGDAHGQLYHQLCICIYVKAVCHVDQLSRLSNNATLLKRLLGSKKVYESAAIRALREIDICTTPSFMLIQSLISGAKLMQQTGRMDQCWVLNSYAARLIVALNYHEIDHLTPDNEEILSAVFWCYYLDRTLSSLFIRPMSLPEPCMPLDQMLRKDESMAYGTVVEIISDLAQVQGELLDLSLNGKRRYATEISARCEYLRSRMHGIHIKMEAAGHSIIDAILKHDPNAAAYKECLSAARTSLRAFQLIQNNLADVPGIEGSYPSFLTWTVFLYPLSPFFVLFCNVVRTTDSGDYLLLQEVTQGLSQYTGNTHVMNMLDLLMALQKLCEPLFQTALSQNEQAPPVSATHPTVDSLPYQVLPPDTVDGVGGVQPMGFSTLGAADSQILATESPLGLSTDELMWQLFNSQLPLGWYDMDMSSFNGQ
ncbi:transcriptional regulator family: Fungal Specific TF [Aspergillus niger]|nr:transcriptional regulator family: Fungal Specific TF [Aspergillus niger]KAI2903789.1 transcriptional regulator family: Fungal Specific TF [Aspergillus niger]KAI2914681.1 transcriptional regulator family: Fungal Specific TF [Aspergillus niger]KAI2983939.1 transcriptional regulator family: Fungal Specific TF [Aspergillus niger]KAI3039328.1 transcriptional regulator family: Fungal Specific TF [Aspergillus niger]